MNKLIKGDLLSTAAVISVGKLLQRESPDTFDLMSVVDKIVKKASHTTLETCQGKNFCMPLQAIAPLCEKFERCMRCTEGVLYIFAHILQRHLGSPLAVAKGLVPITFTQETFLVWIKFAEQALQ